jgi:hypothetical protein
LRQIDTLVPVLQAMESRRDQIITLSAAQQPDQAYDAPSQGPMATSPARVVERSFDVSEPIHSTDRWGLHPRSILGKLFALLRS